MSQATVVDTCSASWQDKHVLFSGLELEVLGFGNVLAILNLVAILMLVEAVEVDANLKASIGGDRCLTVTYATPSIDAGGAFKAIGANKKLLRYASFNIINIGNKGLLLKGALSCTLCRGVQLQTTVAVDAKGIQ